MLYKKSYLYSSNQISDPNICGLYLLYVIVAKHALPISHSFDKWPRGDSLSVCGIEYCKGNTSKLSAFLLQKSGLVLSSNVLTQAVPLNVKKYPCTCFTEHSPVEAFLGCVIMPGIDKVKCVNFPVSVNNIFHSLNFLLYGL